MSNRGKTTSRQVLAISCLFVFVSAGMVESARAGLLTIQATVEGTDQPWNYTPGGLNTNYQYGINDGTAPLVINASNGFNFSPGGSFTVTYVSGLESAGPGWPSVTAQGDLQDTVNNQTGSSGKVEPSYYMNPSTYPIYLSELVGTFADSSGAIVGTPFALGDGPTTITIPMGATQLQLGVNDDIFHDNVGSFAVNVSGPQSASVPEPTSLVMASMGILLVFASCVIRSNGRTT